MAKLLRLLCRYFCVEGTDKENSCRVYDATAGSAFSNTEFRLAMVRGALECNREKFLI